MALTSINIHSPVIRARAGTTMSAPLTISAAENAEVCFYMVDFDLSARLAEAINRTIAEHEAAKQIRLVAAE